MPRSNRSRKPFQILKPLGSFTPRVQQVGPEHFGVLVVDPAKARSKFAFSNFYGQVLLEPFWVEHTKPMIQQAIVNLRQTIEAKQIKDLVVAIEMTGTYHRPILRAFRQHTSYDTRLLHPHATSQFRQPADPGNKTDDTDLAAQFRATTLGFGLLHAPLPDLYIELQAIRRHRRDLVDKNASLQCQIREVLHEAMPGFAEEFSHLWESRVPLELARAATSPQAVLDLRLEGLRTFFQQKRLTVRSSSLNKIMAWAQQAPPAHPQSILLRRRLCSLDDDHQAKSKEINAIEADLAQLVAQTPYVLLMAIPGINVVSAADLAAESGPIERYPNPNAITSRAGLVPSRYQSDRVDRDDGPLLTRGNRRLRAVLMQTADNLLNCNHYFKALGERWKSRGFAPVKQRVKVAKILSRLLYQIVATKTLRTHDCLKQDHYILRKLTTFLVEHDAGPDNLRNTLQACLAHFSPTVAQRETPPLEDLLNQMARSRGRGPELIGETITLLLARLRLLQSEQRTSN